MIHLLLRNSNGIVAQIRLEVEGDIRETVRKLIETPIKIEFVEGTNEEYIQASKFNTLVLQKVLSDADPKLPKLL